MVIVKTNLPKVFFSNYVEVKIVSSVFESQQNHQTNSGDSEEFVIRFTFFDKMIERSCKGIVVNVMVHLQRTTFTSYHQSKKLSLQGINIKPKT